MIKHIIGTLALYTLCQLSYGDTTSFNYKDMKLANNEVLVTKTQHEANKDVHYSIDISYPQLSGDLDSSAKQFNQKINDLIANASTQFKMQIVNPTDATLPAEALNNTLRIDYTTNVINVNNQTLVSLRFYELTSFAGTAHPVHTIDVFNYNLSTGNEIQLSDLFKSDSNYLNLIANYCNKNLKTNLQDADASMIDKGTAADPSNYGNWNLQAKGLLITFNEYQVAAYVYGMPEVLIPYSALQQAIAPDASIAMCAKNPNACK